MAEPGGATQRLTLLQAGRGVAALLVLLFHASGAIFASPEYWGVEGAGGLFRFGHEGVAFFFVLSGFIILHAHRADLGRPERLGPYLAKRATRIYLPYWAVLFPLIAAYLAVPTLGKPEISAPAVMLNSPLLVGRTNHSTLAVAWTLFHELLFYALFGLAIIDRRLGMAAMTIWLAACAGVLVFGLSAPYAVQPINLLFGMGLAACLWLEKRRVPAPWALMTGGMAAFALLGLALDYTRWIDPRFSSLLFGLASTAFVLGGVEAERQGRITAPAVLKRLGDASYALYLTHFTMLSILAKLFMKIAPLRAIPVPIAFLLVVAGCIAAGLAFHRLVERPLMRLAAPARRRLSRP